MALSKQPYKGTRDFYPPDFRGRQRIFDMWKTVAETYGYEPYDAPLLEPLDLYRAKTGEEILNEQTYAFTDRGGREVAIRPEMTPTVARMVAARRQDLSYPLRWYNIGNRWRYERPQRGRVREFWQLDIDIFGVDSNLAELEMIEMSRELMTAFGAKDDMYTIRLNSRKLTNVLLSDYFELDEEQVMRATKLIDRMHKMDEKVFEKALAELVGGRFDELHELLHASELSALPEKVRQYAGDFEALIAAVAARGIGNAVFDITLMRGFDYYTDIVFEVFDTHPENSRSMFGGGRYDGLVGLFGVADLPAVGFGIGEVTMQGFLQTHGLMPDTQASSTDAYIAVIGDQHAAARELADKLRAKGFRIAIDLTGRKVDAQIKAAAKQGIGCVIFVGEKEAKSGRYEVKRLDEGISHTCEIDKVIAIIRNK
jgi:histidyl-tRNA synthetase